MENLLDYVKSVSQSPFSSLPLTDLDFALFNELGYLSLIDYFQKDMKQEVSVTISDCLPIFQRTKPNLHFTFLNTKERIELFEAVLNSKRYQQVTISSYVNDIDTEFERQFAAMVFSIPEENCHQVVFRGTDDSLIGWKEDFKLTYMREIPAHRAAILYLKNILPGLSGRVIVSGHSKGGNLAIYAAAHLPKSLREKIDLLYMFDAPGFRQNFLQTQGYLAIREKIISIKPFESVVGVMLESDCKEQIVASKDKGMAQHLMMNWAVNTGKGQFECITQLSSMSQNLEKTFATWNESLSHYELKNLFDLLFDQLIDHGLTSLDDFSVKNPLEMTKYLDVYKALSPQQKQTFTKAVHLFIQAYRSNALNSRKTSFSSILTKWQQTKSD